MTTKDRILLKALDLFNERGEWDVSALEIANELEMSPGNLYYHFKGKREIVPALLSSFHKELLLVLDFATGDTDNLERYWIYIYIILEEIYDFRFLYLDLERLVEAYPETRNTIRRIMAAERRSIEAILKGLSRHGLVEIPVVMRPHVIEILHMTMTFWLAYDALRDPELHREHTIHHAVFRIMMIILPYQTEPLADAFRHLTDQYEALVAAEKGDKTFGNVRPKVLT